MVERERDLVWDKLVEIYGDVTNGASRGARNKVVKALKESGATPEEIELRANSSLEGSTPKYMTQTANALAKYWDDIGAKLSPAGDAPGDAPTSRDLRIGEVFASLWPGKNFEAAAWKKILSGFSSLEITETLEKMAYTSTWPPGAADVRVQLINNKLESPPPSPRRALEDAKSRMELLASGLSEVPDLHPLVIDAMKATHPFSETAFNEAYSKALSEFYFNYGRS